MPRKKKTDQPKIVETPEQTPPPNTDWTTIMTTLIALAALLVVFYVFQRNRP